MVGTVFPMFIYTYQVSLIITYQIQFHFGKFSNKECWLIYPEIYQPLNLYDIYYLYYQPTNAPVYISKTVRFSAALVNLFIYLSCLYLPT